MKALFLLFLFIPIFSLSQTIDFSYDLAGNQIKRKYNINGNRQSSKIVKEYKDLETSDLEKFFPEDIISYYPNPVKDELYIKWELINNKNVEKVTVFNFSGQIIRNTNITNQKETIINFSDLSNGTYLVLLTYSSGESKEIKIIKNL